MTNYPKDDLLVKLTDGAVGAQLQRNATKIIGVPVLWIQADPEKKQTFPMNNLPPFMSSSRGDKLDVILAPPSEKPFWTTLQNHAMNPGKKEAGDPLVSSNSAGFDMVEVTVKMKLSLVEAMIYEGSPDKLKHILQYAGKFIKYRDPDADMDITVRNGSMHDVVIDFPEDPFAPTKKEKETALVNESLDNLGYVDIKSDKKKKSFPKE